MTKSQLSILSGAMLAVFSLSACDNVGTPGTLPTPEPTLEPTPTPEPTATPEPTVVVAPSFEPVERYCPPESGQPNDWCLNVGVDKDGTELGMTNWPHPMKRDFQSYDVTANGYQVGTYFAEWGIYGRDFQAADIPFDSLTHIYYAFASICGDNEKDYDVEDTWTWSANGRVGSVGQWPNNTTFFDDQNSFCKQPFEMNVFDDYAAREKPYAEEGEAWDSYEKGELVGLFGQFARAKAAHPHIRIQMSIGGWTLSKPFYEMADDPAKRAIFVASVKRFLQTYPTVFDGIDLDWEFPGFQGDDPSIGNIDNNPARLRDGENFADLVVELRVALDELEVQFGKPFELGAAMSADPAKLAVVNWDKAAPAMDFINIMSYDFYGAWSMDELGHQTSMRFNGAENRNWNVESAVETMLDLGVEPGKIIVGVAKYGRGWTGVGSMSDASDPFTGTATSAFAVTTANGEGTPYAGPGIQVGNVAAWEPGNVDYAYVEQVMMGGKDGAGINGYQFVYDAEIGGAYVWNPTTGTLLTIDSKETVLDKGEYVRRMGLGGLFSWEISGDSGALLNAMNESLGKPRR